MTPIQRTRIKICGLTREADVYAAVAAGADAVGFVLYEKSPRYVSPERAAALAALLPAFVTPVLLFVNARASEVQQAQARIPGAWLQFHGDETPAQAWAASGAGAIPYIRAARLPGQENAAFDLVEFAQQFHHARALLLDAHSEGYGGSGQRFNWSLVPTNVNAHLVLSGGLTPANVGDGITRLHGRGVSLAVDVSSGVEASKGIKDAGKIQQFVAAVRAADALLIKPSP